MSEKITTSIDNDTKDNCTQQKDKNELIRSKFLHFKKLQIKMVIYDCSDDLLRIAGWERTGVCS